MGELAILALIVIVIWIYAFSGREPTGPMPSPVRIPPRRPNQRSPTRLRDKQDFKLPPSVAPLPAGTIIRGNAYVIDGDTIVIRKTKIRLAGIDAPELHQPWGQKSKWEMVAICKGQTVTAELNGEASHDRQVGICTLQDGTDIGAELIRRGLAIDYTHFSGGKYRHLEKSGIRQKLNWSKSVDNVASNKPNQS